MNQVRKVKNHKKKKKSITQEEKFQQTIERLQRFKTKNEKLESDLIDLKKRVLPQIKTTEEKTLDACRGLALKLASFVDKKSLAGYYRDELVGWIISLRGEIVSSPFHAAAHLNALDEAMEKAFEQLNKNEDEKLKKKLKRQGFSDEQIDEAFMHKEEQEPTEEEIKGFFEELFGDTDDTIENEEKNDKVSAKENTSRQDDLFGFDDENSYDTGEPFEAFEDINNAEEDFFDEIENEFQHEEEVKNIINGKAMKTLFRRIAKVLHPDLVQTKSEKEEKHHKMAALLKARDENDLAAIFQQYTETVGEIPSEIFNGDLSGGLTKITRILEQHIDQLSDTRLVLSTKNPELFVFYQQFYGNSPQKERKNISNYKKILTDKTALLVGLTQEIRNLSILKECLNERYSLQQEHEYEFWE